ncbi:DNA polymerase III subunit beta [Nonomuraea zeae]|uniref:DNA polymerase III subunit beta n=1 Tax=Nonomuraea zeae TaxID=1642303 RepID=UPI001478AB53|nr:DNA polymerase III subunit beta [Nonomuraea zeae]
MKVSVEPSLFADLVGRAGHHVPTSTTEPILKGLLLEAADDTLTVSAQNRDTSLKASMPAEVAEPGRALLPGRVLGEATKSLAKSRDYLQLAATAAESTITCGTAVMTIRALPADEFPGLPRAAVAVGQIDAGDLREAIAQVAWACKPDKPAKPEHAVIRIDIDGDTITWAGADNYRMAARVTPWGPGTPDAQMAAHVPVREFREAVKDFSSGPVTLGANDNLVSLASADQTATIRQYQIEEYADYQPRLAKPLPTTVRVETEALLEAVKRVTLFTEGLGSINLDIQADCIGIHAGDISLIGRGADTVEAQLDGDAMQLRFQPPFIIEPLASIHTEHTVIGLSAPGRYVILASTDEVFRYLAAPLKPR